MNSKKTLQKILLIIATLVYVVVGQSQTSLGIEQLYGNEAPYLIGRTDFGKLPFQITARGSYYKDQTLTEDGITISKTTTGYGLGISFGKSRQLLKKRNRKKLFGSNTKRVKHVPNQHKSIGCCSCGNCPKTALAGFIFDVSFFSNNTLVRAERRLQSAEASVNKVGASFGVSYGVKLRNLKISLGGSFSSDLRKLNESHDINNVRPTCTIELEF